MRFVFLLLAALAAPVCVAHAAPISVTWTGTVTQAAFDTSLEGQTITGAFTFDADGVTPSVFDLGGGQQAVYGTAHTSSFSLAGLSGQHTGQRLTIDNDVFGRDQLASGNSGSGAYSGDQINGQDVDQIFVPFRDSSATAFPDIAIPASLDPADFDFSIAGALNLGAAGLDDDVLFEVTTFSYSAAAVPLPAGWALALTALGTLGIVGRPRRRTARLAGTGESG